MKVYIKIRYEGKKSLLSICDKEILGKTLKEGRIKFHVKEEFYKGTETNIENALSIIPKSNIVNMIGKKIVSKAILKGYIHPEAIISIEGIPHAQIVRL